MRSSFTVDTGSSLKKSAVRLRELAAGEHPALAQSLLELADLFEAQAATLGSGLSWSERGRLALCNPHMTCEACMASRPGGA